MNFQGTYWLLWEDEPISREHSRLMEFKDGTITDTRTGEQCGTYGAVPEGIDALFNEEDGEQQIAQFRMPGKLEPQGEGFVQDSLPFDPDAGCYPLTWTTVRYEAYLASRPLQDNETDEEMEARLDYEDEQDFGIVGTYGTAMRDCEETRQMAEENARDARAYAAERARADFAAV